MQQFTTIILKFEEKGEKTGWTYIEIPTDITEALLPGNKKSFRVKGKLDEYSFKQVALLPMGDGKFIMPLKVDVRKAIKKRKGAMVQVSLILDETPFIISEDLLVCLEDEPIALQNFNKLPLSHKKYYTKWIESAKTAETKARRIAVSVISLATGKTFGEAMKAINIK
ncbi:YdeI/OmpD-associated family protein [Limnovirga soli]|uniref:DUF1905 domain-containing protein n=1 Tax=Limnovirga soli TaxID=2656915 RepID=A0A8J8FH29_9BACT|nr:YdeI/OmpD-associated family protein [Limnovirga soli]NNV55726.1 DUF1905 domain-containing protein [Limnovirga soli]